MFPLLLLPVLFPGLDDFFEDHIEVVVEPSECACELPLPLHNDPKFVPHAFV